MYQIAKQSDIDNYLTISYEEPVELSTFALKTLQNKVQSIAANAINAGISTAMTSIALGHLRVAHYAFCYSGCSQAILQIFHNAILEPFIRAFMPEFESRDDNNFRTSFLSFTLGIGYLNSFFTPTAIEIYKLLSFENQLPQVIKDISSSLFLTALEFIVGLYEALLNIPERFFYLPNEKASNFIDKIQSKELSLDWDQEEFPIAEGQLKLYQQSKGEEHHLYAIQKISPTGKFQPNLEAYLNLQKLGIKTFKLKEAKIHHDGISLFSWSIFEYPIQQAYEKICSYKALDVEIAYEIPDTIKTYNSLAERYKLDSFKIREMTTWSEASIKSLAETYAAFYFLGLSSDSFFECIEIDSEGNVIVGLMDKDFSPFKNPMENPLSHTLWEKPGLLEFRAEAKDSFHHFFNSKLQELNQYGNLRTLF